MRVYSEKRFTDDATTTIIIIITENYTDTSQPTIDRFTQTYAAEPLDVSVAHEKCTEPFHFIFSVLLRISSELRLSVGSDEQEIST